MGRRREGEWRYRSDTTSFKVVSPWYNCTFPSLALAIATLSEIPSSSSQLYEQNLPVTIFSRTATCDVLFFCIVAVKDTDGRSFIFSKLKINCGLFFIFLDSFSIHYHLVTMAPRRRQPAFSVRLSTVLMNTKIDFLLFQSDSSSFSSTDLHFYICSKSSFYIYYQSGETWL